MRLKLLAMDVDGTLADGKIYNSATDEAFKVFDVEDGYAIKNILRNTGMKSAIITGRVSEIVQKRTEELEIDRVYQGIANKKVCLQVLMKDNGYHKKDVVYR